MPDKPIQHLHFEVAETHASERIDKFLAQSIADKSRAYIQELIDAEQVLVNGKTIKPSHKVNAGERIDVYLKERPSTDALPENIPLDVVYEDEALMVINKPAGMVVHPAYGNYSGTLVNALLYHYKSKLSSVGGNMRPGIVHRIDKDTSGLLVAAKNDDIHAALAKQFAEKTAHRQYKAIVWGRIEQPHDTIRTQLQRSTADRRKMAVVQEGGKSAVTHFRVLERFRLASCIELQLETGRTHQIRIHMAHYGHPVLGDPMYGGRRQALNGLSHDDTARAVDYLRAMPRQALHAQTLKFIHPLLNQELSFSTPLPDDFEALLGRLRRDDEIA